jgi:hypothetical protein
MKSIPCFSRLAWLFAGSNSKRISFFIPFLYLFVNYHFGRAHRQILVEASPAKTLYCLTLDWFEV